ncbi:unnamed protein product [Chondrus crispus]|uniref:Uncharacterized protein n=1 Tax=Chondrus crispus TaxID=2769 RepID=R7Q6B8_CHOCR|nr:unnamed protein product [Chondrus crispus]CDF32985.1 unnamed protein product [Chondrus crispus]|eukprot:XP_005712788.1 unnamed protein product [Chondrus crispus]
MDVHRWWIRRLRFLIHVRSYVSQRLLTASQCATSGVMPLFVACPTDISPLDNFRLEVGVSTAERLMVRFTALVFLVNGMVVRKSGICGCCDTANGERLDTCNFLGGRFRDRSLHSRRVAPIFPFVSIPWL